MPRRAAVGGLVVAALLAWQPGAQAQQHEDGASPALAVSEAPSPLWIAGGIAIGGLGLALNIDSARRLDDGERGCFPALELGGCYIEALAVGPVGTLGGLALLFHGLWLGEHEASVDLAAGRPLRDHSSLRTWMLLTTALGYVVGTGVNVYVSVRLLSEGRDACEDAPREQRPDACYGGEVLGLAIVQSAGFALMLGSAGFLGYAQGYRSKAREATAARLRLLPLLGRDMFGVQVAGAM